MNNTITFTARSQTDKEKVVTLTLQDDRLQINLTGLLQPIEDLSNPDALKAETKQVLKKQIKPGLLKISENISGPMHIADVQMHLKEDDFNLTVWKRMAGLRLAPINISIEQVDNPDAASAFLAELQKRKKTAGHSGKFFGPLDYWAGWAVFLGVVLLLVRWPKKR